MTGGNLPVLIPVVLFAGALLIPLVAKIGRAASYAVMMAAAGFSFVASAVGLYRTLAAGEAFHYTLGGWQPPIGIELVLDPLSAFFCLVITGVGLAVLWHSRILIAKETPGKEAPFYSAALLLLGGLCGIVMTGDLFNLYVFLEISSIATYALVAIGSKRAAVAAFRYLIYGTIGASFYLLGVGFLLVSHGSLNMADVAAILAEAGHSDATLVGVVLIVVGLGIKMALFPLHGWLADAYTHASSAASALVAPVGTKVAIYALIRIGFFVLEPDFVRTDTIIGSALIALGVLGILWGGLMAIAQTDLKRMLAFSSVSHVGYIAVGIGLASPLGLIAAILHTLNHAMMKGCLFMISGSVLERTGNRMITRFDHTLRVRMPWTMGALVIVALSMIGLPPMAGFFTKWYLVLAAFEQGQWLLIAVIILSSLFGVVYFFRILERVYLRPPEEVSASETVARGEAAPSMLWPVLLLAVGVVVLGLGNFYVVKEVIEPMLPGTL